MPTNSLNVLIAEDEVLVAESVKGMLLDLGHTVAGCASNGFQAIALATKIRPDVILMDIKMPEMNGLEAAHEISETCPTPIIILTAFESRELVSKASLVGAGAFLTKPTTHSELERALTIATARFEDYRQLQRRNEELVRTLEKANHLKAFLPICSGCKKIRDENNEWHPIEVYIRDHAGVDFTHGYCPNCLADLYKEYEGLG